MIHEFIRKFTQSEIGEIMRIRTGYYLVNAELMKIKNKISKDVFSIGVFLGEVKSKKFTPSMELISMLAQLTDKKIIINDKAEWLFLCGRDVFRESVVSGNLKKNELYLIQNYRGENLGIGRFDGKMVKNSLDKGMYLRMER